MGNTTSRQQDSDPPVAEATVAEVAAQPEESKIGILVVGRVGAGKSTLINAIRGERDVRTEKIGLAARNLERGTETYTKEIRNDGKTVILTLTDTNGMCDGGQPKQKVKNFCAKKLPEPNLILICIRLTERFDMNIFLEIRELQTLYKQFWEHSIIVLTFANKYAEDLQYEDEDITSEEIEKRICEEAGYIYSQFNQEFVVKRKSVSSKVLANVPFICTGRLVNEREKSSLAKKMAKANESEDEATQTTSRIAAYGTLPTSVDWFSDLMHLCVERCSKDSTVAMRSVYMYLVASEFATFRDSIVGLIYKPGIVLDIFPHEIYMY